MIFRCRLCGETECGARAGDRVQFTFVTSDAPPPTEPIVDPAGRIAGHLPCIACGYNLHTLAEAGRCPECGEPVKCSTVYYLGPQPAWLKRLAEGVNLLTTGVPVLGVGAALLGLGSLLGGEFSPVLAAVPVLLLGVVLIGAIALLEITIADPIASVRRRKWLTWRRVTSLCVLLIPVGLALAAFLLMSGLRFAGRVGIALALAGLPLALLPPAFFCHMAVLMTRVLRPDLARTGRRLAGALALAELALVLWYGSTQFVPPRFSWPGVIPLSLWGAGFGVILVLGFIFMIRAGRALTAAQRRAEHWLSGAAEASTTDSDPS